VNGLAKLLEKDGVPKNPRFNATAVATWWQVNLYSGQAVIARSEPQTCNEFPIRRLRREFSFTRWSVRIRSPNRFR
jgi:hypothetical protein